MSKYPKFYFVREFDKDGKLNLTEKVAVNGLVFTDYFQYLNYYCKDIGKVVIDINCIYQVLYIYDKEFYTIPRKCLAGPKNVKDALFIHLFSWTYEEVYSGQTEYHPYTYELVTENGLKMLLENEKWEFVDIPKNLPRTAAGKLSVKTLLETYKDLIESFQKFYFKNSLDLDRYCSLTKDWLIILQHTDFPNNTTNCDINRQFNIEKGIFEVE